MVIHAIAVIGVRECWCERSVERYQRGVGVTRAFSSGELSSCDIAMGFSSLSLSLLLSTVWSERLVVEGGKRKARRRIVVIHAIAVIGVRECLCERSVKRHRRR